MTAASWRNSSLSLKGHIFCVQSLTGREATREVGMRLTWNSPYVKNFQACICEEHQNDLSGETFDSLFQAYPIYLVMMISSSGQALEKEVS